MSVSVNHSVSAKGDRLKETEITQVADRLPHGEFEASHQRGSIAVMMITTLEIESTGDEIEKMTPTILVRPGTVARIESVTIMRVEGAGKKFIEPLCSGLAFEEGIYPN